MAWHSPSFLPFVNQVAPGPQTLARTGLPTYSPEQYYISCPDSNCSDPKFNATSAAIGQMGGYATNAWMDARFGLHSWPLCVAPVRSRVTVGCVTCHRIELV